MTEPDRLARALALIDSANAEDPNQEQDGDRTWAKELLYSMRMSEMLERFAPDADEAMQLAARAQHIRRWTSARTDFPEGRQGYLQWRTGMYKFHAETAGALLAEAGYDQSVIDRVQQAVGKRAIKLNPDSQLIENIAALVFLEHYMLPFASKHPEYDEAKWLDIIRKAWKKLSESGRAFAVSGKLRLPEPLVPLIQKALAEPA
ncbi:MAG: DUF4202 domain-containing protein [Thiohalocapsa sp.]